MGVRTSTTGPNQARIRAALDRRRSGAAGRHATGPRRARSRASARRRAIEEGR